MKKIIVLLVLSLIFSGFIVVEKPQPASAYTQAELAKINAQIKALQRKKAAARAAAADAKQKKANAQVNINNYSSEIAKLQKQIDSSGQQIQTLQGKIVNTELTLADAQDKMDTALARVKKRNTMIKARLRLMYMKGTVSYLDVLFDSSSFSDFFDRLNTLEKLIGQDKIMLKQNRKDLATITVQNKRIRGMLSSLQGDYSQMASLRNQMVNQEAARESQVQVLKKQVAQLEELSAQEEAEAVALAKQEARLIAKRQQMDNTYTGGTFGYPLLSRYPITSEFGGRIDPITGKAGAQHNGMDFGAPAGSTIVAAEAGTVVTAGWVNGYGYTVVISHGELWTWYCHMQSGSIAVSSGDRVSRGQKVGRVGSTGRSTGPHLHFGVYNSKTDQWLNPRKYLNL
jgi:murein DD-endopeptidase MepM/ murein hydrolase activator NlpD